ncbi:NAD(P)H-dependent glycerol-3-phosphate dehydrogenase [Beggiatoa leptomitoformis]|uniref:Glycerol-3-phosphate dehydrogenase [NAD(P)+] n=2 Tax=Beggiatoa leptomitoformis TaxID=288004 RepID=A0A2N9YIK9_9GAMM|nr:NAD(P)H-dependent glycerol-3-phosphate dehydrogenase [Beggiatoa leptomitoformis]ALG67705.1 NAD(P)H-dependent glycerol-3-phosphate dehydrogenase [Beggiatoa leptomitoformis]AUI70056.1 NAD(P)H-dependent glycerol-3-phosphate dehydrogenase [Beggiatoa leptomitoformis]
MLLPSALLVFGAGSWGTALALVLARQHYPVYLWGKNPDHVRTMQEQRCNARFLPNAAFPDNLQAVTDFATLMPAVQDIIIVVPSHGFRETLQKIKPYVTSQHRLCWATKGLEYQTGLLLHEVARAELGENIPLAVLSGPSFASEVAAALPTAVTIATNDTAYARHLAQLFHHSSFRAYTSNDMVGVQIGGAVKNVIAIATGIADGLKMGANTRAALITRGLSEIVRLGTALGGQRETFMGLAGLGDLVLTCTDNQSRNRRFGYYLAQGTDITSAQAQVGQVVEGVHAATITHQLAQKHAVEMPIVEHVNHVLTGQCTLLEAAQALLAREPKPEM